MSCNALSPELLESYILDRLPRSQCEVLEGHILACETCAQALWETEELISSFRDALTMELPTPELIPQRRSLNAGTKAPATRLPSPAARWHES